MADTGYSGTSLIKKSGIKPEMKILAVHQPDDYFKWLGADISQQFAVVKEIPGFINRHMYTKPNMKLIFVYEFSLEKYTEDFEKIIEGKYSEISPENKLKISKFWEIYSGSLLPAKILEKHEDLKYHWLKKQEDPVEAVADADGM